MHDVTNKIESWWMWFMIGLSQEYILCKKNGSARIFGTFHFGRKRLCEQIFYLAIYVSFFRGKSFEFMTESYVSVLGTGWKKVNQF